MIGFAGFIGENWFYYVVYFIALAFLLHKDTPKYKGKANLPFW